jgi:hypothetical protein
MANGKKQGAKSKMTKDSFAILPFAPWLLPFIFLPLALTARHDVP